jgi:hypothetical protein
MARLRTPKPILLRLPRKFGTNILSESSRAGFNQNQKAERRNEMSRFSPKLTRTLCAALDDAAVQVQPDSPTKAFMAEQILKAAADGVHRREELSDVAVRAALGELPLRCWLRR